MRRQRFTVSSSLTSLWAAGTLFFLGGCAGPQSVLDPAGPSARAIAWLWWGMFIYASLVLIVIVGLWLHAMRREPAPDRKSTSRHAIRWIVGGGVVLPVVSLGMLLAFGIPIGHRLLPLPLEAGSPLRIEVTGHRWWWEVVYPEARVALRNELHLPAGVPVDIRVTSADVIHSFWLPRLGGKIDAIPGHTNVLRLVADVTGSYPGQCSEFCGAGHARMRLEAKVHSPSDFDVWLRSRQRSPAVPENETASRRLEAP
ncbi:cytochrome c oxidase subunit II [Methylohalobius crimeensis]|uniref:cytochrome c oxidase subunit II n=1 Tax=Methylohalobius crimeensis TaxID=244365 RepID=UPI0003B65BF5|nr:cytochrome c oxidase subunit II [Methylohalobius crimeensis]